MILINQIITFYAAKFKRSKKDFSVDGRIVFLHGDICGGKTLVILGALNSLSPTRPIFELQHA
jgi:tRNA A37 threonylcarbamoyladenosine biosynthesis protein TsaE